MPEGTVPNLQSFKLYTLQLQCWLTSDIYNRSALAPWDSIIGTSLSIIISDVTRGSHDRHSTYCLLSHIRKPRRQPATNVKISFFLVSPDPWGQPSCGVRRGIVYATVSTHENKMETTNSEKKNCSSKSGIIISFPEELQLFLRLPFKSSEYSEWQTEKWWQFKGNLGIATMPPKTTISLSFAILRPKANFPSTARNDRVAIIPKTILSHHIT